MKEANIKKKNNCREIISHQKGITLISLVVTKLVPTA